MFHKASASQFLTIRYFSTINSQLNAKIAFVGLGQMGSRMAPHLIKKDPQNQLYLFDVNDQAIQQVIQECGAENASRIKKCSSLEEAAKQSEVFISMLPGPKQVQSVYEKILPHVSASTVIIDASTIDPQTSQQVAKLAKQTAKNELILDAPVSGGIGGAGAGTLTFMVGGSEAAFEKAKPFLQLMGKNIVHCGESGMGQVAKIANNLILAISMAGVSEAMLLGSRLGMDPKKLAQIINTSSGRCWSSDTYNPFPGVMENVPSSRGYTGGFACDLMLKDVGLALSASKVAGSPLPMGEQVHQLYQEMSKSGLGGKDFSGILEHLKNINTPKKN